MTQSRWSNLVRHLSRQEIIARITATHLHYVRLGTESGNIFGQNEFGQWHDYLLKGPQKFSTEASGGVECKIQIGVVNARTKNLRKNFARCHHSPSISLTPAFKPV